MDSLKWHPIHQRYWTRQENGSVSSLDVDPAKHLEALFGAVVPGGLLLKLVTPSGSQITFVPGGDKGMTSLLRTDASQLMESTSPLGAIERTAPRFALDAAYLQQKD
ncbi:hypothetical protein [Myxococcus sp. CA040A]|uniref:hypothetical protein n=1 Tax=Myxococcus sp. CA040A TaxID=2741738 RepID=UPI00157BB2E0|nr:hypothetical protein [Myxococcus sp. CA040A]NTX08977.1 hypothetical protein [Myxococcus sp. CA040A]